MSLSTRVRILFQTDKEEFRRFYWVELKNKDLYWGGSTKGVIEHGLSTAISPQQRQILIPDKLNDLKETDFKYSYHESGDVHLKKMSKDDLPTYENHASWKLKQEILGPTRFFALITMPISNYQIHHKKINGGGTKAFIINVGPDFLNSRFYLEFFLCTHGKFKLPPSILQGRIEVVQQIKLNEELSLVIGCKHVNSIGDFHTDLETLIIPTVI